MLALIYTVMARDLRGDVSRLYRWRQDADALQKMNDANDGIAPLADFSAKEVPHVDHVRVKLKLGYRTASARLVVITSRVV